MVTWSLIGVGIAGRARARALLASEHDRLAKVWRGRFAGELGVPVAKGFDEALEGVEAVAIASPSEHHPAQVRAALHAGRHVVCEFPLARTPQVARELFTLARRHERILHVEHIELLEPAGRTLCAQAPAEVLQSVSLGFQRPGPEGAGAPSLAHANVARVHRLVALAGPVRAIRSVTHRPGQNVRNEISMRIGYPFSDRSNPFAQIGSDKFQMFTGVREGGENRFWAWLKDTGDEGRMANAMRRGSSLIIKGTSERGTLTTDRYSLSGVTAALNKIDDTCR